jgi:hypothetical protein
MRIRTASTAATPMRIPPVSRATRSVKPTPEARPLHHVTGGGVKARRDEAGRPHANDTTREKAAWILLQVTSEAKVSQWRAFGPEPHPATPTTTMPMSSPIRKAVQMRPASSDPWTQVVTMSQGI